MTHEETLDAIQALIKRPITFSEIGFKGTKGWVPEYFNFMAYDVISSTISGTQEECAVKLLDYLKSKIDDA